MLYSTGNTSVDAIGQIHLEGNIIPHKWFNHVRFENGKPDLTAIVILSEIIYWYRPIHLKDEATGRFIGVRKRFKSDLLQRSYDSFSEQFGITKRQAKEAIFRLEELGFIKRHFRTIQANNTKLNNVLFIELLHSNVIAMTLGSYTYDASTVEVSHPNVTPITSERQTNTEITTEITTEINNDDDDDDVQAPEIKKPPTAFQFYEQNGFGLLSSYVAEKVNAWIDDLSEELVIHAMKLAIENNVLRWNYVETILKNWSNKKLKTISEVEADQLRFEAQQKPKTRGNGKSTGRKEVVPEWFNERNNKSDESVQVDENKQREFEDRRKKLLESLEIEDDKQ